jgi:hypothetical protein
VPPLLEKEGSFKTGNFHLNLARLIAKRVETCYYPFVSIQARSVRPAFLVIFKLSGFLML